MSAGGAGEELVEAVEGFVDSVLHDGVEHSVAILLVSNSAVSTSRVRSPRSSKVAVSTKTWLGLPSHSKVLTSRSGDATSR
jgi:hypothetical protein